MVNDTRIEELTRKIAQLEAAFKNIFQLERRVTQQEAISRTHRHLGYDKTQQIPGVTGTPAGSDTQVQFNDDGAFGGIPGATYSGGTLTLTTPTITKPVLNATNPTAQTYAPSAAATATLDLSLANEHRITMPAGNITIALSNDTNGQKFIVSILQDSGGSRTVTWFTTIRWAGGSAPTLTTTASKRDVFGFIRTGSGTYDGFVIGQNL